MKKIIFILTIFLLAMYGCEKYPEAPINDIAIADKVSASTKTATISGTVECPVSITKIELWIDTIESSAYPKVYTVEMKNKNFAFSVTGLLPITTYYYRYVAYNSIDTVELEEKNFTTMDGTLASITTAEVTQIGPYGAVCGGNISNDGSYDITARGVCWSTQPNPTTENDKTEDGKGKGSFTSNITNIKVHTTYYVRAYATNAKGTVYGEEKSFTTNENELMVSTADISNITRTTATCGGTLARYGNLDIIARGVCWSTSPNPTIANNKTNDGTSTGFYTSNITNLSGSTKYYVRAYATNSIGTVYGEEKSFITTDKPTVSTGTITSVKATSIVCGGNLISTGNEHVTESGICWSTTSPASINNNKYNRGISLGSFTVTISGLNENTIYFVRAYATNGNGTAYGEEIKVRTLTTFLPGVTTSNVTSIATNSAVCGGNVNADGNLDVTARGVCWSTSPNPTINDSKTINGTGTGSFTSNITGLTANTTYYVRAYATNSKGTAYGEERSFTTIATTIPQITTANVTSIRTNGAVCGGNVTSDGYLSVTSRGVCWSTSPNPTINDSKTINGTGTGSFTSNITGLTANTTYYVRAYATNSKGTAYGEERSFRTSANTGTINGYTWVDLGLSSGLKWATCNVGATTPEGYGNYYAWGETSTKTSYVQSNSVTDGQQISDFSGNATYDAARANWGSTWRMPTKVEVEELVNNCTWTWTTQNGVNGMRVTGPNGNSIFLPAAGYRFGSWHYRVGEFGNYLSSTPYESGTDRVYDYDFDSGNLSVNWDVRYNGHTIRPVTN